MYNALPWLSHGAQMQLDMSPCERYIFSCSVGGGAGESEAGLARSAFDVVRTIPRCDLPARTADFGSLHRGYPALTAEQAHNPEAAFHGRVIQPGNQPQSRRLNVWFIGGLIQHPEVHYESNYFIELLKFGFPDHQVQPRHCSMQP
jgi:hypothetical protein